MSWGGGGDLILLTMGATEIKCPSPIPGGEHGGPGRGELPKALPLASEGSRLLPKIPTPGFPR